MTPTRAKKPVNVRAFVFNGHIDCLDQDHVNAKLLHYTDYDSDNDICEKCNQHFDYHAYINTISGIAVVCPGNYVINNPQFPDDYYPCKPDIFNETYDDMKDEASSAGCENTTYSNSSNDISDNEIKIISLKLNAAKTLIDNSSDDKDRNVSLDFMKQLIGAKHSELVNDGMLFGEVMALINKNSEILVSRKTYDVDYIFYNSETGQFMSYSNGKVKFHEFDSKDYTANDWYIVN